MKWFLTYLTSSIGKKQVLGAVGAFLVLFLVGHLLGNLQLLKPDAVAAQASYNAYTEFLTGLKPLIWIIEAVLCGVFALHVLLGLKLKIENHRARGANRYAVSAHVAPTTIASSTMVISGLVILAFVIQHLLVFKYGTHYLYRDADGKIIRDMWLTTIQVFSNPCWTAFYVVSLLLLGCHLIHAIPSLFRTFGLDHPKWTPLFAFCGVIRGAALAFGFAATAAGTFVQSRQSDTKALMEKSFAVQGELANSVKY